MPDFATTRDFIARHVGGEWRSVCFILEEDLPSNPKISIHSTPDHYATHFESAPMPIARARDIHNLLDKNYRQIIQITPQADDQQSAILRINVKKAAALMANQNFCNDTAQTPLCELTAAKAPSQSRAKS